MIAPMSGPWARQGELMQKGAEHGDRGHQPRRRHQVARRREAASCVVVDAGDNAEKAKNAAQRLVAQEPDLVGATGAWLSSFTLAVTEVTERAELPCAHAVVLRPDHRRAASSTCSRPRRPAAQQAQRRAAGAARAREDADRRSR